MSAPAELRAAVAERDGWTCRFCGRGLVLPPTGRNLTAAEIPTVATIDHWVSRSRGGTWDLANLVLACRPCNDEKGPLNGPEYLAVLAYRRRQAVVRAGLRLVRSAVGPVAARWAA